MKNIILTLIFLLVTQIISAKEIPVKNVLIVYGSFLGSTKEIAEKLKTTLENKKISVDIMAAENKKEELAGYDMIIIGSAIHGAQPHPAVIGFIEKNRDALKLKRTAVFIVCITITSDKPDKKEAASRYPDKVAIGFTPVSTAVFAGTARDAGWFGNWMGKMILGIKPGDYRDWKKIEEWTVSLVENIK
jgi:menaquinone-dependent protoporphyrinogen oxidase